jgi:hypothetical protein
MATDSGSRTPGLAGHNAKRLTFLHRDREISFNLCYFNLRFWFVNGIVGKVVFWNVVIVHTAEVFYSRHIVITKGGNVSLKGRDFLYLLVGLVVVRAGVRALGRT